MLKQEIKKYEDFWGVSGLEIRVIYPKVSNNEVECTSENYPNCNLIIIKQYSGFDKGTFVALCRKELNGNIIQDKCTLGKIFIRYEGEY